jgi:hypothetical protein
MTENKTIGVYYVDTTDLDGWTDETLAGALRGPLAEYGIDVDIGNRLNNPFIFGEGEYTEDTLRDIVKDIVDRVVTDRPVVYRVEFGPTTPDEYFGTMDEIEEWLDQYITNHLQYGEDFETEKQKFLDNHVKEV